ncbi:DUF3310 domain-containing protein [Staphylococcus kloosii]|jgi:hypothetical protein|uniref:DUF3310 domain-containing protein n=1 Tax=Staphylococcus kloosii TaxID=29384 RepID=UPI00189FF30E|nr:DUF3310 domain-containing protein [Staphylococcus kloosii]MBF7029687.1 DUF3310 domain-containing protein [Staphylococcus kloosii]
MRIKDLNLGDTIRIPNGQIPLEGKVVDVSELVAKVHFASVGYKFIYDSSEFELIRNASENLDPIKWLESHNDTQQRNDNVNHPAHYTQGKVEVIEFIEQVTKDYNANVAYHIGNAIKYIARSPHKNGKEDIAKAKWYIERAFERWEG